MYSGVATTAYAVEVEEAPDSMLDQPIRSFLPEEANDVLLDTIYNARLLHQQYKQRLERSAAG